jgi:hypothetical protein
LKNSLCVLTTALSCGLHTNYEKLLRQFLLAARIELASFWEFAMWLHHSAFGELEKQQQLVVWRIVVLKGQKEYKPDHTSHISCSCAFSLIIYFNNKSRKRKKFLWFYGFSIAWVPRKVNCKKDGGFLFLVCF